MVRYPLLNRKAKRKARRRNKVNLGSLSRDCSNCDEERKEEKKGAEHPSTWICAASTHFLWTVGGLSMKYIRQEEQVQCIVEAMKGDFK